MKTSHCIPFVVLAVFASIAPPLPAQAPRPAARAYRADRVLMKPKPNTAAAAATAGVLSRVGARVHRRYEKSGVEVLTLEKGVSVEETIRQLKLSGAVEYAEPDYEVRALGPANDPRYSDGSLWGLNNTGQSGGTNDADIDAPEAWDTRNSAPNIVVAVIDTGIRYTHEDLAANMWRNAGEIAGNGIDDDANGVVDDVFGINTVAGTGNPLDDNGHGTHCAGTIGAVGNNGKGIAGVAWNVRLMACKFLSASGSGNISDAIECINYAVANGANVLSNSWGGGGFSAALSDAIEAARSAGVIFVAAAGNDSANNDLDDNYPSNYPQDNIVAVASSTRTEALSSFSNYGATTVDLAAPGSAIYSTYNNSDSSYAELNGTSMATPHVAGAVALLRAQFPAEGYQRIIQRLLDAVDRRAAYAGRCTSGGRLNLRAALTGVVNPPVNDAFTDAIPLTGSRFTDSGNSSSATRETGEPSHGGQTGTASLWWRWTASGDGPVTITTEDSAFNTLLGVYTGTTLGNLNFVAGNDNATGGVTWSSVTFNATRGTTYVIAVDGVGGGRGAVVLNGEGPSSVPNDFFTDRTPLTGGSFATTAESAEASKEPGEPNHGGNSGGRSVWWTWTAPASGSITITTDGSNFDTLLAVYTGTAVGALTLIDGDDDDGPGLTSQVNFNAVAGTAYAIAVDGYGGGSGRIVLRGSGAAGGLPVVTLTSADANANEGTDGATFTVTRAGTGTGTALVVSIAITGTATSGSDYAPLPTAVTIPVGSASATINVTPTDDLVVEESESVIATVQASGLYELGSPATATVTIADNDAASAVTIEASDGVAGEAGSDPGRFTLRRAGGTAQGLAVNVHIAGSAVSGTDFASVTSPISIPAGAASVTVDIVPIDDAAQELTETVTFTILPGPNYLVGAVARANVILTDNDRTQNNDAFANRAGLGNGSFSTAGSTVAASKESGEPNHAGIAGGKSVWFEWTAGASGETVIDTFGSNFDTLLAVYVGSVVSSLTAIASNDDAVGTGGLNSRVTFAATAGTTYVIAVDGYGGSSGTYFLNAAAPVTTGTTVTIDTLVGVTSEGGGAPAVFRLTRSDAGAQLGVNVNIGGSATNGADYDTQLSTVLFPAGATTVNVGIVPIDDALTETDETVVISIAGGNGYAIGAPSSATVTIGDNDGSTNNDAFSAALLLTGDSISTTGTNAGATKEIGEPNHGGSSGGKSVWWRWVPATSHTVVLGTFGSDFDTLLGVYTGSSVDALTTVAGNDDSGGGRSSQVSFSVFGGATYYIAVDGYAAASGAISLQTLSTLAENDLFEDRIDVGGGNFNVTGSNIGASVEADEPTPFQAGRTVWWTWTPVSSGPVTIRTAGSTFDTVLSVFSGNSVDHLTLVVTNDDYLGRSSRVSFNAQAFRAYQISVGSFSNGAGGEVVLSGTISPFPGLVGVYRGLIVPHHDTDLLPGAISLTLTKNGRFTGVLIYDGLRREFAGIFDDAGAAALSISRGRTLPPLQLALGIDLVGGTNTVTGSISDGFGVSTLNAQRAVFDPRTRPAPQAGQYTALFQRSAGSPAEFPSGIGYAALTVSTRGAGRVVGKLSDGTVYSRGVQVTNDGLCPFFLTLYGGQGAVSGLLAFEDRPGESDLNGILTWSRPVGLAGRLFPAGFNGSVEVSGSRYVPTQPVLDFGQRTGNTQLDFEQADLVAQPPSVVCTLETRNIFQINRALRVTLSINASAGTFKGTFYDPAIRRDRTFGGAVYQKLNFGAGMFLGTAESGAVNLSATPP